MHFEIMTHQMKLIKKCQIRIQNVNFHQKDKIKMFLIFLEMKSLGI